MSDDADYFAYGTPLEDEEVGKGQHSKRLTDSAQTRALPVWQQVQRSLASRYIPFVVNAYACCPQKPQAQCACLFCSMVQHATASSKQAFAYKLMRYARRGIKGIQKFSTADS